MRLLLLGFSLLFACTSSDSSSDKSNEKTTSVSKRVDVELIRPNVIQLEEVSEEKLRPLIIEMLERELTEIEEQKLFPILQLMRSSCSLIWEKKGSLAQGLILPECLESSNDIALMKTIALKLANETPVEDIVASLALSGPYFKKRDQDQVIEVWLSAEKPLLSVMIKRILQLSADGIHFHLFGENDHPSLPSSFMLNLSEENRQKLSDWVAGGSKIEQFVSMIEENKSQQSSINQNQKEAEQFGVRSSPTWFVNGYRLRGLQSVRQIERFYRYP